MPHYFSLALQNQFSKAKPQEQEQLTQAMSDPAITIKFQDAIISSAQTDSEETHRLLADLLAERIAKGAGTTQAMILDAALNTVPKLSLACLRGCAMLFLEDVLMTINNRSFDFQKKYDEYKKPIDELVSGTYLTNEDIEFLVYAGCASHSTGIASGAGPFPGSDQAFLIGDDPRVPFRRFSAYCTSSSNYNITSVGNKIGEISLAILSKVDARFSMSPRTKKIELIWK